MYLLYVVTISPVQTAAWPIYLPICEHLSHHYPAGQHRQGEGESAGSVPQQVPAGIPVVQGEQTEQSNQAACHTSAQLLASTGAGAVCWSLSPFTLHYYQLKALEPRELRVAGICASLSVN